MLDSLLHISINGPFLKRRETDQFSEGVNDTYPKKNTRK